MYQADARVTYTRWQGERELRGESRDKRCREPYRKGGRALSTSRISSAAVARCSRRTTCTRTTTAWCAAEKCISQRLGNLWRTGQWRPTFPTKLRVTLSFSLLDTSFPLARALARVHIHTYTHTHTRARIGLNNFYSLFGQTRCTMRRDVSILERPFLPADSRRIYRALADHLGWIVRAECVQCSRLKRVIFFDSRNPFIVIFLLRNRREALKILCLPHRRDP